MSLSPDRVVFYVSDGTGITAETLGESLLAQFPELSYHEVRAPFIDSEAKALELRRQIDDTYRRHGVKPLVFSTLVQENVIAVIRQSHAHVVDLFGAFIGPLEQELGMKSTHSVGRFHGLTNVLAYQKRIEAINYALAHDDGISRDGALAEADIILVGVSRSGKTPTRLYLTMSY